MSNPSTTAELFTLESVVRGHHIYKRVRTPMLGEKLQIEIDFNLLRKFISANQLIARSRNPRNSHLIDTRN